jgi:putative transposase
MSLEFKPLHTPALAVGLALRTDGNDRLLRITHLFKTCAYVMWVRNPEDARYARRPIRILLTQLEDLASSPGACWGALSLPTRFLNLPSPGSEQEQLLDSAWRLIEPLVQLFDLEKNLGRSKFSTAIRYRAERTGTNFITLRRLILRYYYYGRNKSALLSLPSGPNSSFSSSIAVASGRRRGPQPILASTLGPNHFIVSEQDVTDMIESVNRSLKKGVTYLASAHEKYLGKEFRKRHPQEYARYVAGQSVEPVTYRQFRYYVGDARAFDDDLNRNLRGKPSKGPTNVLRSSGPGEIYEIDATGGRIALISKCDPAKLLGTPWIYILIDRWSRYIPGVYVTLKKPSYEEVRMALLASLTSRDHFRFLGLDIDDQRFPIGVPPAGLCTDRGSELISESIQRAVSDDLRIDLIVLPPYCPDAKAIVERLIRELKRRMTTSRLKGVYADRPMDPESKRGKRRAFQAAAESNLDLFRVLLTIVDDHNNRTHPALRRRAILAQAGIKPTPKEAYLWGLENVTGLRRPPLSDEDFYRMLMSTDYATLSDGVLRYPKRDYYPVNEAAKEICERSPRRRSRIMIKIDKGAPYELFIPRLRGEWAHFRITEGAATELAGVTLDEEEALVPASKYLVATADHEARVRRIARQSSSMDGKTRKRSKPILLNRSARNLAAAQETSEIKRALTRKEQAPIDNVPRKPPISERWKELAERERLRAVDATRKRQGLS